MKEQESIKAYKLSNHKGLEATILDVGLILQSLTIQLPNGEIRETVLGLPAPEDYLSDAYLNNSYPYLGAFIGRYANRISDASFTISGRSFELYKNNGPHCLHGGKSGFDNKIWKIETADDGRSLVASYLSPDGEEGFPGNLTCQVTILVTDDWELIMSMEAQSDQPTPVNLTWHPYFNLDAQLGNIEHHKLQIHGDHYLPQAADLVPLGHTASVANTNRDFRQMTGLERCILEGGMDTSFVVNHRTEPVPIEAATLTSADGLLAMKVSTDAPIVHVYTAQSLPNLEVSKGNAQAFSAICLECQQYTDGINQKSFPDTLLHPGKIYRQKIVHSFSVNPD